MSERISADNIIRTKNSLPHDSARTHVSGQSEFVDDKPLAKNEVIVGLVWSPHAKARIKSIDKTKALAIPGVVCVLDHNSLHHKLWGTIFQEQPFLALEQVEYVGEVVAVVGALTRLALAKAIAAIKVEYEILNPILSIDAAIAQKNFIGVARSIQRGEAKAALAKAKHKLKGQLVLEGAEHFYLENQAAIAYPKESGQIEVHSSTQHPTETQHLVAEALGLAFSDVVCVTKRLGGGFGGKETQAAPFAVYAAMVAKATGKIARIVLTKDDDMIITGKRNPFQIDYEIGFEDDGSIAALEAYFYSDGGAYADLSTAIMERALLHADNAYYIPHVTVTGQVCRTNFHSHTAFRGFGGPKGVGLIECLIEDVAKHLGRDALDIRKLNCYQVAERNVTHYNQVVENNKLPELFVTLEKNCEYRKRRQALDDWNNNPVHNPRGMALTAVKFGISFTTRFLNQGNALVNIHRDGSIQVSTGAVEMGQGVNSRIAALVAEQFGLDPKRVRVMSTSTEKNANTSPTAASSGTDLNGAAAVVACQRIRARLTDLWQQLALIPPELWANRTAGLGTVAEINNRIECEDFDEDCIYEDGKVYLESNPTKSIDFATLVGEAYFNRISLCDYGYYKIQDLGFNKVTGQGRAFLYFTQGVACSEVELDQYTGQVKVLRTDILMDLGKPINYHLDVGQVAGAFIQGMGWVTTEALFYDTKGKLLSHSPSTYKIPSIHDTPRHFQIDLLENDGNVSNVRSTKAAGEPPLMLCFSVWNAIRDAVAYHQRLKPLASNRQLYRIPATAERVLRALRPDIFLRFEEGAS